MRLTHTSITLYARKNRSNRDRCEKQMKRKTKQKGLIVKKYRFIGLKI